MATGDAELTTIDEALDAFVAEQEKRLADRTFRSYVEVIGLFRHCMNGYGPSSLTGEQARRWEAAYEADDDAAFTGLSARRRSRVRSVSSSAGT